MTGASTDSRPPESAPPPRHLDARLAGPTASLDRRIHAWRTDLADIALRDRIVAPHYAEALPMQVAVASAMLRGHPSGSATAVSELLYGEAFNVLDISGGWAWGWCGHDRYVGYVAAASLTPAGAVATHRITAGSAPVFSAPDIKSPVAVSLPMGALAAAAAADNDRFLAAAGGFIHRRHLAPIGETGSDPVAVAQMFSGAPYLWGGRTRAGIDCSGLVQMALMACGIACPRDSDQQRESVGRAVAAGAPQRGDLVFFPGHVGLMADSDNLLHANAFWMTTLTEPLADVINRLRADHAEPVLAVRRL